MTRSLSTIRTGALALLLAGVLADCGGGGGGNGGGGLQLFFGMSGDGSCQRVVVDVDLAAAGAVLSRDNDGAPDCAPDVSLANSGCEAAFAEVNGGDDLRVTIDGCTIPAITNLFSCFFDEADISELNAESGARCTCTTPGCDVTPALCIDENPVPQSCEACSNGVDDDADGLVDCDDPNCENSALCETPTTTTTSPSPTTTTTTTLPRLIDVNFTLTSSTGLVGNLQLTVNYASAPGQFVGMGEAVACASTLEGVLFAPNDKDSIRRITFGLISLSGIVAPTQIISCRFDPGNPVPVPANFTVVVNDSTDPDGSHVSVKIGVTVVE